MSKDKPSAVSGQTANAIVAYGLDETGKARAARFTGGNVELLKKTAAALSLKTAEVTNEEIDFLAKKLPAGRLYSNGKGFVPNIKQELYDKLLLALGVSVAPPAAIVPKPAPVSLPMGWLEFEAGHLVLAHSAADEGWWEAIVTVLSGDLLTLRWRDFPKEAPFVRHRSAVALLNPIAP